MPYPVNSIKQTYWYALPQWVMINPEPVQSSAPLKKESAIKVVERVPRVTPTKPTHAYKGRLIDYYV